MSVSACMSITTARAHEAWRQADRLKKLSDRLVGIGPFGIGLDGILAWIPGVNLIYGGLAGLFMLGHGIRAQASPATLLRMAVYIVIDNAPDLIPIPGINLVGSAVDMLFPGHLMAAGALQKDIEARHGPPPEEMERRAKKHRPRASKGRKGGRAGGIIEGSIVR